MSVISAVSAISVISVKLHFDIVKRGGKQRKQGNNNPIII